MFQVKTLDAFKSKFSRIDLLINAIKMLFFIFIAIMASPFLKGQDLFVFPHQELNTILPSLETYALHQALDHKIWIGTDRGVVCFNGQKANIYTTADGLTGNMVRGFYEDDKKRLWFFTFHGGPCYWDGRKINKPKIQKEYENFLYESNISSAWVDTLTETMYFALDLMKSKKIDKAKLKGVFKLSLKTGILEKANWKIHDKTEFIYFNPDIKNVFLYSANFYITNQSEYDKKKLRHKVSYNLDSFGYRDCVLWRETCIACVSNVGLTLFEEGHDPQNYWFFEKQGNGLGLYQDKQGQLFIHTIRGVFSFDEKKHTLTTSILGPVTDVLQDKEGNFWYTTLNQGVLFYPYTQPQRLLGLNAAFTAIETMHNKLYVVSLEGDLFRFSKLNKSSVEKIPTHWQVQPASIRGMSVYKNQLLFGYGYAYNGQSWDVKQLANQPKVTFKEFAILPKAKGLIGAHALGIIHLDTSLHPVSPSPYQLEERIESIYFDSSQQKLWVGTLNGLYHLDQGSYQALWPTFSALRNRIVDIQAQGNYILFASHGAGLLRYHRQQQQWTALNSKTELISDIVHCILVLNDQELILGTDKGIQYLSLNTDGSQIIYSHCIQNHNGLQAKQVFDLHLWQKTLIIATDQGVFTFPIHNIRRKTQMPNFNVEFFVNKKNINSQGTQEINLNYTAKEITLKFQSVGFSTRKRRYRYQLQGQDQEPALTQEEFVTYTNLNPGTYQLQVQLLDESLQPTQPLIFTINIQPHFTQTTPFLLLLFLAFGLFSGLIVFWIQESRKRKVETAKRLLLAEIQALYAQMNPHFLFNAMNSISFLIATEQRDQALSYLYRLSSLIRSALENAQHIHLPIEKELENIKAYLTLESLRLGTDFHYSLNIDLDQDQLSQWEMPAMILQPIIENAILHGLSPKKGPKELTIKMYIPHNQNQQLIVLIQDNGIGRSAAQKMKKKQHQSLGWTNIQNRLDLLQKLYKIPFHTQVQDLYDSQGQAQGTQVLLSLARIPNKPLNQN